MAEAIDTAYITIKPDTRGFGAEARRQVASQMRTPMPSPAVAPPRPKKRDLLPSAGIRGPVIKGLLSVGTSLTAVTGGIVATTLAIRAAFNEMSEGQAVAAQTAQVIKSTGNVAGVSAKGVAAYSGELSKLSGIDDEVVQTGANVILTFKNIRNIKGPDNDIFDQTLAAAADLSRFGGGVFGDFNSASKQLGKALNDPIKGMTALTRSGITFSAGQKETIKNLVATGRTLEAQKIILKEVNSQVGGSAEAYGQTLPGAIDRLKNSVSNLLGSGLERIAPDLGGAADAAADFFEDLESGGRSSESLKDVFTAIKSAVVPLFNAVKSEGPRFANIFKNIKQIIRNLMPSLKLIGVIIGVTLVLAFKLVIRVLDLFFANIVRIQGILKLFTQGFLAAIDGILGGLSFLSDAASHIPFIGDQFAGVSDNINAARDYLRAFSDELDAANGKEVKVDVVVRTENTGSATRGERFADRPDASGGTGGPNAGQTTPGPRQQEETRLINQLQIDQAREDVAAQRRDLAALQAFYTESIALAKQRGVTRRDYVVQLEQTNAEIRQLNEAQADAAQQAADDQRAANDEAKQAAADRIAAVDEERRSNLEASIQLAALTKRIIRDDKVAWAAFIAYLKQRVAIARAAGVGIKAARLELKQAQQDAIDVVKDFQQTKFDEQEAFLSGQVDLFDITGQEAKQAAAFNKLIAFYKRMIRREGLTRAQRQKYRIELARTRKDLADLRDDQTDTSKEGASFGQLATDFLKQLHGFSSNLASNVMPRGTSTGLTEALVQARSAATVASEDFFGPQMGTGRGPDGGPIPRKNLAPRGATAAQEALADREKMQGQATAAQMERLLSQNAAILRVLRRIAADQDHPEAKFNRKSSPAAVVVGVS